MVEFVAYPDARLRLKAQPRPLDAAMLAAGEQLLAAAREAQAFGLAAAHLGHNEPVIVVSVAADGAGRDHRLFFNPEIVERAGEVAAGPEGSVSMPGIEVEIERAVWVAMSYDDASGTRQTARFENFVARVIQHEIDQMNGIFFLERLSRLKRDIAIRKFAKLRAR